MWKKMTGMLLAMVVALATATAASAAEVPRTSLQDLKAMIDGGEPVIIVDTRRDGDWEGSKSKIKGAQRVDDLKAFAAQHPKDTEIVFYCA